MLAEMLIKILTKVLIKGLTEGLVDRVRPTRKVLHYKRRVYTVKK